MEQRNGHDYKNRTTLYHLTTFKNIPNILLYGLQSRFALKSGEYQGALQCDVADKDIINYREKNDLTHYIPFHFLMHSPFAGDVMNDIFNKDEIFVYIVLKRSYARAHNFKIIPKHPMCKEYKDQGGPDIYDYDDGMEIIDWDNMNKRDFRDYDSKIACLAECISDEPLNIIKMLYERNVSFAVKNEKEKEQLMNLCINCCEESCINKFNKDFFQDHIWVSHKFF